MSKPIKIVVVVVVFVVVLFCLCSKTLVPKMFGQKNLGQKIIGFDFRFNVGFQYSVEYWVKYCQNPT